MDQDTRLLSGKFREFVKGVELGGVTVQPKTGRGNLSGYRANQVIGV